jgi:hypothetical protein
MSQIDFWYVRFPDGRVLRAASTSILRQELTARRIPLGSTVRRSPSDEWVSLEWTQEFADLVEELAAHPPVIERQPADTSSIPETDGLRSTNATAEHFATVGSRLDPARLHLVGVRGYLEELLAALDSALVPKKLLLGLIAGLLLGILFLLERASWFERDSRWLTTAWSLFAVCMVVFAGLVGFITRLTYVELARLRPARWREGLNGLGSLTFWIIVSKLIVWGAAGALIVLLRWLPYWAVSPGDGAANPNQPALSGTALVLSMVVEALLYPVFSFWFLMPILMVVSGSKALGGLRQWLALLRRHLGHVFLYQTMAIGLGALVTAPFLLLIAPLFLPTFYPPVDLHEVARSTRLLLLGLACTPFLTYWITANVFIYLNLRYGAGSQR